MKAFDTSRSPKPDYLSVAWPAPGAFPLELCPTEQPWSVTLNPSYYSYTGQENVILERLRDGAQWHFSATSIPYDGFFTVNTQGYGVPYCVIFRPEPHPHLSRRRYLQGHTLRPQEEGRYFRHALLANQPLQPSRLPALLLSPLMSGRAERESDTLERNGGQSAPPFKVLPA